MKVLAVMGSHRSHHQTAEALDYFLEQLGADDVQLVDINKVDIHPCIACDYCLEHQKICVQKDDMEQLYPALMEADLIVMAAPVYFSAFPAKVKNLIDRGQLFFNLKDKSEMKKKKIVTISLGGAVPYDDQFVSIYATLRWFQFNINAVSAGAVEIPDTDRVPFKKNKKAQTELIRLAESLK